MFRSKFIVKKVGKLDSGVKNERDANGAEQKWQAREVVLEENNPQTWRTESVKVSLRGEDAYLALVPGMEVEMSIFLGTHEYNGEIYNDVHYKSLKVIS